MASPNDPPPVVAEPAQAQPPESTPIPSSPSPAPAHEQKMAQDISESDDVRLFDIPDSELPPLPNDDDDDSFLNAPDFGDSQIHSDGSALMDREMKRQLLDIESSFIPEASLQAEPPQAPTGADDTYLFGGSPGNSHTPSHINEDKEDVQQAPQVEESLVEDSSILTDEPPTPAGAYKTPAARREGLDVDAQDVSLNSGTATSEDIPSSPLAQAAQRNASRALAADVPQISSTSVEKDNLQTTADGEQSGPDDSHRPTSSASTVKGPADFSQLEGDSSFTADHDLSMENITINIPPAPTTSLKTNNRPSYLQNRHSSQRSSVSSFTNQSELSGDGGSSTSLGADYALQSGGAAPRSTNRNSMGLSRLPSLGSIASSVSGYSDSNPSTLDKARVISTNSLSGYLPPSDSNLGRLEEEVTSSTTPPATPRPFGNKPLAPTDTVIARHVQDIQVPDTIARAYREKHSRSPEKRHLATPFTRNKHNLTLKEQNSKIDKLSKENFDLKLKIHFLDQALQNRSDEGVKEMIQKNVQLQTDLANEKKENQSLRKKIRDLERKMSAQEEDKAAQNAGSGSDDERSDDSSRQAEMEEEIFFLKDRIESQETLIEQLQQEAMNKEVEKRRMAEYIKSMGDRSNSEPSAGVNEAIGMWKEEIEEERTRRAEAEAEADKLREEVQRLKEADRQAQQHSTTNHNIKNVYNITRRNLTSYTTRSNPGSDVNEQAAPAPSTGGTSSTLVDQLKNENSELRRDLGAQTSMLTSRNRERERLQQEIESLKLTVRRGDVGSVAGDSIFERSISRNHMRSVSRASGGTRGTQATQGTQLSDAERDDYESKYSALRDELSQTKLQYKELDDQLNGHLDLLEQAEGKVKELENELDLQTQDLQALQGERDEALEVLQDKEQECEELRQQALETIQRLEGEIDQKEQECGRLVTDLENMHEDFDALQNEMKNISGNVLRLEDEQNASLRKIQTLEAELDDANQELTKQDKVLTDEKSKNERLEIQLESCQSEIDFLREEQEGDKIKIGELESSLNTAQNNIQDEKERFRDLEDRLTEERQQRDILDNQEKQEVEKIITDLNTQLTKLKEDNRKLRKNLSGKEVEASTWKERLDTLESDLREALGNLNGTRSSFLKDINKLQRDLDATVQELTDAKNDLSEKDRLLRNRDALLESTGMESRRLSDLLERERQARRQDQAAFENAKRGHQSVTRTIQQHETRVIELETQRSADRRKILSLENTFKEQLMERNNLLYALWNRLSTLCGAEWSRSHAVINGELTSMELISKNITGFNKNMILAVKTIENIIGGFRSRIRNMEKDLLRDYQTLEHTLDVRVKRLDQLEKIVVAQRQSIGRPSTVRGGIIHADSVELNKLRNENKTLRTEVQTLRQISTTNVQTVTETTNGHSRSASPASTKRASMAQTLLRHHSTSAVEGAQNQQPGHPYPQTQPLQPSEQKWIHRLKELERRLKAEREARLLDRSGARKRLEQKVEENADLRAMLERERERKEAEGSVNGSARGSGSRAGSRLGTPMGGSVRGASPHEDMEMY